MNKRRCPLDECEEELKLMTKMYADAVAAASWMQDDESLNLMAGDRLLVEGVKNLRAQRDQLRAEWKTMEMNWINVGKENERLRARLQATNDAIESAQVGTYPACPICNGEIAHDESCVVVKNRTALREGKL